jgi:hypothetical protein
MARPATAFPSDPPALSLITLLYALSRAEVMGGSIWRALGWALVLGPTVWFLIGAPGSWVVLIAAVGLLVALQTLLARLRRHDFVYFAEGVLPSVASAPLDAKAKIPLHVTGLFTVEQKIQRFVWLPGFYRTFATREHALLCQVVDQRLLGIGRPPEAEIGMWYIFFTPDAIQQVRWGALHFGRHQRLAIAITYTATVPKPRRPGETLTLVETAYLTFRNHADGQIVLADLLYDQPGAHGA